MYRFRMLALAIVLLSITACGGAEPTVEDKKKEVEAIEKAKARTLPLTEEQWKKELAPDAFYVARQKGTERSFTGKYVDDHRKGVFRCICCGDELFKSDTKFESGTGWPSFWTIVDGKVASTTDNTHGMVRTEVTCKRCGAHLGHVFEDGPKPTGLRYCINSVSIVLDEDKGEKK